VWWRDDVAWLAARLLSRSALFLVCLCSWKSRRSLFRSATVADALYLVWFCSRLRLSRRSLVRSASVADDPYCVFMCVCPSWAYSTSFSYHELNHNICIYVNEKFFFVEFWSILFFCLLCIVRFLLCNKCWICMIRNRSGMAECYELTPYLLCLPPDVPFHPHVCVLLPPSYLSWERLCPVGVILSQASAYNIRDSSRAAS